MVEAAKDMVVGEKPKVFAVEGGTLTIVAIDAGEGGFIGDPECGILIPKGSGVGGGIVVSSDCFVSSKYHAYDHAEHGVDNHCMSVQTRVDYFYYSTCTYIEFKRISKACSNSGFFYGILNQG